MSEFNNTKIENIGNSLILATEIEIAELRDSLGDWTPGDNSSFGDLMPVLRMAWRTIRLDEPGMRNIANSIGAGDEAADAIHQMINSIEFAEGQFRRFAELCEAARIRVNVHASAETCATA